eukprot:Trichotokara_eunicae@DN6859_c0_g1_i1.p1
MEGWVKECGDATPAVDGPFSSLRRTLSQANLAAIDSPFASLRRTSSQANLAAIDGTSSSTTRTIQKKKSLSLQRQVFGRQMASLTRGGLGGSCQDLSARHPILKAFGSIEDIRQNTKGVFNRLTKSASQSDVHRGLSRASTESFRAATDDVDFSIFGAQSDGTSELY